MPTRKGWFFCAYKKDIEKNTRKFTLAVCSTHFYFFTFLYMSKQVKMINHTTRKCDGIKPWQTISVDESMVEFYENNGFIRATVVAENANADAEEKAKADQEKADQDAKDALDKANQDNAQKALDDEYAEKNGGGATDENANADAEGGEGKGDAVDLGGADITGDANKDATSDINALNADLTNAPAPKKSNKAK